MTGLSPYSQSLGDILPLFESGNSEQLREFTRGIENRPNAVLAFERAFNSLMDESAIDWEGTPDQRAFLKMISESHEALETFLVNMPSRQKLGTYLIFRNHGAQATVELGWLDARAGEVTWDRWTGTVDDPVMAFADIGLLEPGWLVDGAYVEGRGEAGDLQVNRRHPVYRSALQLVNALCYITAYPDDITSVWPEGTPLSLKEKADSGRGKEAMRAKSKLAALGYVPVHVCGQRIEEQRNRIGIATLDHGHVASHWRRGHW